MTYEAFKSSVLGKVIGDGQCVALVVNNPESYTAKLFPGVAWENVMASVPSAKDLAGKSNQYITWVANDHNNANQVPTQGDIMVFDATPQSGYTNQFVNPDGHCGVCDSADSSQYSLLQQNSPSSGSPANVKSYPWKFRPCLGWYTVNGGTPAPAPSEQTIFLPPTTGPWHLYASGYAGNMSHVLGLLYPSKYGGLTYNILASLGNGVYRIKSEDFGVGDLFTKGSDVTVS